MKPVARGGFGGGRSVPTAGAAAAGRGAPPGRCSRGPGGARPPRAAPLPVRRRRRRAADGAAGAAAWRSTCTCSRRCSPSTKPRNPRRSGTRSTQELKAIERLFDYEIGYLPESYDENWKPVGNPSGNPGHLFEWASLLSRGRRARAPIRSSSSSAAATSISASRVTTRRWVDLGGVNANGQPTRDAVVAAVRSDQGDRELRRSCMAAPSCGRTSTRRWTSSRRSTSTRSTAAGSPPMCPASLARRRASRPSTRDPSTALSGVPITRFRCSTSSGRISRSELQSRGRRNDGAASCPSDSGVTSVAQTSKIVTGADGGLGAGRAAAPHGLPGDPPPLARQDAAGRAAARPAGGRAAGGRAAAGGSHDGRRSIRRCWNGVRGSIPCSCASCHGSEARGGESGPNLLRSPVILEDQDGELLLPIVQAGPTGARACRPGPISTDSQIKDIAAVS